MEKENIKIRKKDGEFVKAIKISGDILVPDTKPDIINIIGSNGLGIVKKQEIMDSRIRLEGVWNGIIIYLSDLGETKALNVTLDFLDTIENELIKSVDEIEYFIKQSHLEFRILNERKINVEIILEIVICDYKIENIDIISSFDEDENIQKLENNLIIKEFMTSSFTKNVINEDVKFSESGKAVEILKQDIKILNVEKKISYNKILAKAEANINILYLSDKEVKKFSCNIPVMSFLEVENVKEDNIIDLNYEIKNFLVMNKVLENGILNFDFEYEITCNVYNRKEINIIEDLYSLNSDINYSKKNINIECVENKNDEIFEYNEKIGIEGIKDIYDYEYSIKKVEKCISNAIEVILELTMYYSKIENNGLLQKSVEIPLIVNSSSNDCKLEIEVLEIKAINGEYICNVRIKSIENVRYKNISILNECEVVESSSEEKYSLVIYCVKPNDTIWKIAKNFKVSLDNLIKLNNLSNPEKIIPGEKLYIMRG